MIPGTVASGRVHRRGQGTRPGRRSEPGPGNEADEQGSIRHGRFRLDPNDGSSDTLASPSLRPARKAGAATGPTWSRKTSDTVVFGECTWNCTGLIPPLAPSLPGREPNRGDT